jgi:hypothetical protein
LLQVARQWEEEGYVDPASFAELVEDEEQLKQVRALLLYHSATDVKLLCNRFRIVILVDVHIP